MENPEKVAIVALGPSSIGYVDLVSKIGSRRALFDEVWTVNKYTGVLEADRIFHMDDFKVQEARAAAGNEQIGNMLSELKRSTVPIYTSRAYPDYPQSVEYPIEDVLNRVGGMPYFNNTMPYAIAFAAYLGVKELFLFGLDYYWPTAPQKIEKGRACTEFWLGMCVAKGIRISTVAVSILIDGGAVQFYGYDTRKLTPRVADGKFLIDMEEIDVPTAEAIETRYDHTDMANLKRTPLEASNA